MELWSELCKEMQCCLFHGIYLCILGLYLYFIHFQKPREQMKNNKCFTGPAVPNIHDSLSHGQMSRSPEFSRLPAEKNMEKNGAKGVELTQAVKFTSWNSRDAWQKCMRTHTHTCRPSAGWSYGGTLQLAVGTLLPQVTSQH